MIATIDEAHEQTMLAALHGTYEPCVCDYCVEEYRRGADLLDGETAQEKDRQVAAGAVSSYTLKGGVSAMSQTVYHELPPDVTTGRLLLFDQKMVNRVRARDRGKSLHFDNGHPGYAQAIAKAHAFAGEKCINQHRYVSGDQAAIKLYRDAFYESILKQLGELLFALDNCHADLKGRE